MPRDLIEERAFDLALSRFGAMFFGDRLAAIRNIGRALRPRGHLAILSWQELSKNEWLQALRDAKIFWVAVPRESGGGGADLVTSVEVGDSIAYTVKILNTAGLFLPPTTPSSRLGPSSGSTT